MTDFPQGYVAPLFITTRSQWSCAQEMRTLFVEASAAWPTANLAIYIPFGIPFPYTVARFFWINGSSAGSNWNMGVYSASGTQLGTTTGSTAGSGNTAPQFAAPSGGAFVIGPGRYYWAIVHDSTTANRVTSSATPTVAKLRLAGCLQEAAAFTLPASMTGAAIGQAFLPNCGITRTASGF